MPTISEFFATPAFTAALLRLAVQHLCKKTGQNNLTTQPICPGNGRKFNKFFHFIFHFRKVLFGEADFILFTPPNT
jgi:hypothetical protein